MNPLIWFTAGISICGVAITCFVVRGGLRKRFVRALWEAFFVALAYGAVILWAVSELS